MPRIIVKCRYYQSEKTRKSIGGLLKYIATREGVAKLSDSQKNKSATEKQKECIDQFVNAYRSVVNMPEYSAFEKSNTRGNASELIAAVIEMHPELLSGKTYLDYIATRPRVERISGLHGLFSDEGSALDLADEIRKMESYSGNVYSVIISIKREDAERLSYNNAEKWRDMIRANKDVIAKAHGIPLDKLCWYGAFHNEKHHPHVHLMLYSKDDIDHGYLNNKGIELMRKTFGKEIFRADLQEIYDRQTQYRNLLTSEAIEEFDSLSESIKLGLCYNPVIIQKAAELAGRLQSVKGKKVYGYLPPEVKHQVDDIVDELEKDENVKRLYDLWYLAKCEIENTYTDHFSPKLPLAEENVFKPIRNAVIKIAFELGKELNDTNAENEKTDKEGCEIITDNTQLTIFGGFAPNSESAQVLSKALGTKTVQSGSVSRGKNDPSQSLQMIERPLLTPDELKSLPKGTFCVMKTGFYPMQVRLKLFFKWGIVFSKNPYIVPDKGNRKVSYANKSNLEDNIIMLYAVSSVGDKLSDEDIAKRANHRPGLVRSARGKKVALPKDDDTDDKSDSMPMTEHNFPKDANAEIFFDEKGVILNERLRDDLS